MLKYSDNFIVKQLREGLSLSVTKKQHNERTSSVAISSSGSKYLAGLVESDTNTFNISSEHIALVLSTISNDYKVSKIVTMIENGNVNEFISPITLKIIKDHSIRTGINIQYTLINTEGDILLEVTNTDSLIPFYSPKQITLARVDQSPSPYHVSINNDEKLIETLKKSAIKGLGKNFPLYDSASGYATAVYTKTGKVYFAGQYSSPDKRMGLHSEVNALLGVIMNKEEVLHIGLVSSKYTDSPCHMCGNCRQFVTEMSEKFGWNPTLYLFAKDTDEYVETELKEYLPSSWKSKKW